MKKRKNYRKKNRIKALILASKVEKLADSHNWVKPLVELGFSAELGVELNSKTGACEYGSRMSCILEIVGEDYIKVDQNESGFTAYLSGSLDEDSPHIEMIAMAPTPVEAVNQVLRDAWMAGDDERKVAARFACIPPDANSIDDIVIAGAGKFTLADLNQIKSIFSIR